MARWQRIAATDESTPPERPRMTAIGRARLGAHLLDRFFDERRGRPRRRRASRRRRGRPRGSRRRAACARPRGGTGCRRSCAPRSAMAQSGVLGLVPMARKPSGRAASRRSPWLIHTSMRVAGARSARRRRRARRCARPRGRTRASSAALDLAAEEVRHELHAVADAERGQAEIEELRRRRAARPRRRRSRGRPRG